jgi:hypothetical protein
MIMIISFKKSEDEVSLHFNASLLPARLRYFYTVKRHDRIKKEHPGGCSFFIIYGFICVRY